VCVAWPRTELEHPLALPSHPGVFSESDVVKLPVQVRRMLTAAIAPGTPLAAAVRLRIRGSIKLTRWLPFRSSEVVAPGHGFEWRALVAGVIAGFDRYIDGEGEMQWKLGGVVPVAAASGPDVSRSAAGREAGEAFWLPTALLPAFGVTWRVGVDGHPVGTIPTAAGPIDVEYRLDADGRVISLALERWGDPDNTGRFGLHKFGGTMTQHRTFHGITIPTKGSVGWHFETPRWAVGEFFRFQVVSAEPLGSDDDS
jgi:hypothetical protein